MSFADIAIILILVLTTLGGLQQGFVLQCAGIFGALAALAVAGNQYGDIRGTLAHVAPHSPWLTVISYLIVFLVVWGAIILLARRLRWVLRRLRLGGLDRIGGIVLGFLQGVLIVEVLLYLSKVVPNGNLHRAVAKSVLAPVFNGATPYLHGLFPHLG